MKTLLIMLVVATAVNALAGEWKKLPPLPDKEGFGGSFAGVSHGALLVAGGGNFPDKKPWEDGKKTYYDTVFVLEQPDGQWKVAGRLPRPLGYGVSITQGGGLMCVGGSDLDHHYADVFRLEWRDGNLITTALPPLPQPLANSCGALVGDVLYIAGGLAKPDATGTLKSAWRLDLAAAEPKWATVEPWPGRARMLAVAASRDGAFWLCGGVDLSPGKDGKSDRHYLTDAFRYEPAEGWRRIADLPHSVVAGPTPAPADATGIYILGGDDGVQAAVPQQEHRGFFGTALRYDAAADQWSAAGKIPAPRATVPCVLWNKSWVMPGGEVRPGMRTADAWTWSPETSE